MSFVGDATVQLKLLFVGTHGVDMVDRLRGAAENLEAPTCPNCLIEMRWFRSELVRDMPTTVIAHQFVCPSCERTRRVDTAFKAVVVPPDKLAGPRDWADAA